MMIMWKKDKDKVMMAMKRDNNVVMMRKNHEGRKLN